MSQGKSGNRGIIGNVSADKVAVGDNAQINQFGSSGRPGPAELDAALQSLRSEIDGLNLANDDLIALRVDLELLKREIDQRPQVPTATATGVIESLMKKLKLAGVAAEAVVSLAKPLKTLPSWVGILPPG